MLADILITILLIASTFYLTIVLLRFLLQLANSQQSQTTRRRSPQPSSDSGHVDEPPGS